MQKEELVAPGVVLYFPGGQGVQPVGPTAPGTVPHGRKRP